MYICICNAVTDKKVREAINSGCETLEALQQETGLGTGCGRCCDEACDILKRMQSSSCCMQNDESVSLNHVQTYG